MNLMNCIINRLCLRIKRISSDAKDYDLYIICLPTNIFTIKNIDTCKLVG